MEQAQQVEGNSDVRGVPAPRMAAATKHDVSPSADEVAHAERLHGLVHRVLETGARTVRDPRALAVLAGVTDADRVYVASVLALQ